MFFNFNKKDISFNNKKRKHANQLFEDLLPVLAISTTSYDYGEHDTGTNTDYIFTITNSGNEVAEDITVAVTGTGFSLLSSAGPFNAAPDGGTANVTVRFTPSAAGAASGSLTLSWPNRDDIVVGLSGTGVVVGGTTLLYDESANIVAGFNNAYSLVGGRIAPVADVSVYTVDVYVDSVVGTPASIYAKIFNLSTLSGNITCNLVNPTIPLAVSEPLTISSTGWHTFTFTTPVDLYVDTNGYAVTFGPTVPNYNNYCQYARSSINTVGDGKFSNRWNATTGAYVTGVDGNMIMKVWV